MPLPRLPHWQGRPPEMPFSSAARHRGCQHLHESTRLNKETKAYFRMACRISHQHPPAARAEKIRVRHQLAEENGIFTAALQHASSPGSLLQWLQRLWWAGVDATFKGKRGPGTHPELMLLFRRISNILLFRQPFEYHQQFPLGVRLPGITIKIFCRLNNRRLK